MTKTQTWNEVSKLLVANKASKELTIELEELLAPKGGSMTNPPKLDKDGKIVEAWCRWHQRYEKTKDMVMSNGKSKGYCKASISFWNKTNANIKSLDQKAIEAMTSGEFENAQEYALQSKKLKDTFNKPEFFDYDRDWKVFNTPKAKVEKK
jgi:hypothetical protein